MEIAIIIAVGCGSGSDIKVTVNHSFRFSFDEIKHDRMVCDFRYFCVNCEQVFVPDPRLQLNETVSKKIREYSKA